MTRLAIEARGLRKSYGDALAAGLLGAALAVASARFSNDGINEPLVRRRAR
jgi:hypothetical protein